MYIVDRKRKHAAVKVVCGGCHSAVELTLAKKISVPQDGNGKMTFFVDGRPRTPTGGRRGMPGSVSKRICFPKMHTVWGCLSCQMTHKVINERL